MSDQWHTRYARQIALSGWGEQKQRKLQGARVFIVGLGGLGSPVAMYLAAAGVGTLVLNDFDSVDLSNLPRQPLHGTDDIDRLKVASARETLLQLNPKVTLELVSQRLSQTDLEQQFAQSDVVVDCSDNFGTRFAVNSATVKTRTPLVSAAAIRGEGQLAVFRNDSNSSPCYRCLYSETDEAGEDCQGQGVIGPLVGVMGSLAATATLNILVFEADNSGKLMCFDAHTLEWRSLKLGKDPHCPECAQHST